MHCCFTMPPWTCNFQCQFVLTGQLLWQTNCNSFVPEQIVISDSSNWSDFAWEVVSESESNINFQQELLSILILSGGVVINSHSVISWSCVRAELCGKQLGSHWCQPKIQKKIKHGSNWKVTSLSFWLSHPLQRNRVHQVSTQLPRRFALSCTRKSRGSSFAATILDRLGTTGNLCGVPMQTLAGEICRTCQWFWTCGLLAGQVAEPQSPSENVQWEIDCFKTARTNKKATWVRGDMQCLKWWDKQAAEMSCLQINGCQSFDEHFVRFWRSWVEHWWIQGCSATKARKHCTLACWGSTLAEHQQKGFHAEDWCNSQAGRPVDKPLLVKHLTLNVTFFV